MGKGPQYAVDCGAAHGALAMTTPGDTTMATLAEVEKVMKGGGARVDRLSFARNRLADRHRHRYAGLAGHLQQHLDCVSRWRVRRHPGVHLVQAASRCQAAEQHPPPVSRRWLL